MIFKSKKVKKILVNKMLLFKFIIILYILVFICFIKTNLSFIDQQRCSCIKEK